MTRAVPRWAAQGSRCVRTVGQTTLMAHKPNTRSVEPSNGRKGWDVDNPGTKGPPVSHHRTQNAAQQAARQDLKKTGGGELVTKNTEGVIRAKDTVDPGNDPRSRKG